MRARMLACVALVAGLAATGARAGEFKPTLVPDGAQWVIHLDVDALKQATLGNYVMDQLKTEMAERKLSAFAAVFGFDPRSNLSTVTVFGKGREPGGAALVMEGQFDAARLITLLMGNQTYTSNSFKAYTIHGWIDNKNGMETQTYGCIRPDGKIVISQDRSTVENVLDVLDGAAPCVSQSAGLRDVIPATPGAIFVAAANMGDMPDMGQQSAVLNGVQSGSLVMSEQNGTLVGSLALAGPTAEMANQTEAVARGMIAFAYISAGTNNPTLTRVIQAFGVSRNGNAVIISIKAPVGDILKYLQERSALMEQARQEEQAQQPEAAPAKETGKPSPEAKKAAPADDAKKPADKRKSKTSR